MLPGFRGEFHLDLLGLSQALENFHGYCDNNVLRVGGAAVYFNTTHLPEGRLPLMKFRAVGRHGEVRRSFVFVERHENESHASRASFRPARVAVLRTVQPYPTGRAVGIEPGPKIAIAQIEKEGGSCGFVLVGIKYPEGLE
jgi:hypothetical protein